MDDEVVESELEDEVTDPDEAFDNVEELVYDDSEFDDQGEDFDADLLEAPDLMDCVAFTNEDDEDDIAIIDGFVDEDDFADISDEEETEEDNIIEYDDDEEEEEP